jgi:ribosomal protein S18 acetylase RimI-like enzyme
MSITVRRATRKDAALIATLITDVQAIHAAALPDRFKSADKISYAKDAAAILAKPQSLVFVADIGDEAAGYIHAEMISRPETSLLYAEKVIYIHAITVRPSYRRRGVGTALMEAVRATGQALRIELFTLNVWMFNEAARQFFRCHGFDACSELLVSPGG